MAHVEQVNQQDGSIVGSEHNWPENPTINHQFNVRTITANDKKFLRNFTHILSLTLAANLLNFGSEPLGSPMSMVVTITNSTSVATPVRRIVITGLDKGDFTQTNTCGSGSRQITVVFTNPLL